MINETTWKTRFIEEMGAARTARQNNNEGKARVCARRAAGAVAGEYLQRHGISDPTLSAYQLLRQVAQLPDISSEARQAAEYLILRVSPEFNLPESVDLIREALMLASELLQFEL